MTGNPGWPRDSEQAQCRTASPLAAPVDRRRPNRPQQASADLLPLLRFEPSPAQIDAARHDLIVIDDADDDDLGTARGLAFGVAVSGLLCGLIAALLIWFG